MGRRRMRRGVTGFAGARRAAAATAATVGVATALGAGGGTARAQTEHRWLGSSNNEWLRGSNWTPSSVPGAGATARFEQNSAVLRATAVLSAPTTIAGLFFTGSQSQFTIDASASPTASPVLTLSAGVIQQDTTLTQTINVPLHLATAGNFAVTGAGPLLVSGGISGSVGLTKSGSGLLIFTGETTYTGTTIVTGGRLQLGDGVTRNGSVAGDISLTSVGSRLFWSNPDAQTYGGSIGGAGNITKNGAGLLTLTGISSGTGFWSVERGTTRVAGTPRVRHAGIQTDLMLIDGAANEDATLEVAGTDGFTGGSASFLDTDAIGGQLFVGNVGRGTLILSGGAEATVRDAYLAFDQSGVGTVSVSGGDGRGRFSTWTIQGPEAIIGQAGEGTLDIANGGRVNVTGALTLARQSGSEGALNIDGGTLTAGRIVVGAGSASIRIVDPTAANGGGHALVLGDATNWTLALPVADGVGGAGSIRKVGAGTLTITGANTYSGGTRVSAGTLALGAAATLGTGAVTLETGGTLAAAGGAPVTVANAVILGGAAGLSSGAAATADERTPGLLLAGPVTLSSDTFTTTLTVTGTSRVALAGSIGEADGQATALVKTGAGTLELRGDSTYTGGTLIRQGTLVVNNAFGRTALGSGTGEGAVTVARGATLTGAYRITGAVQVNSGGTLSVGNSIGAGAVGFLSLAGGSVLDWEIGADGVSADRLDVSSLLARTGDGGVTFALSGERLADGSVAGLSAGTFTLLTFGASSGFGAADFFASGLPSGWEHSFALTAPSAGRPGALTLTLRQLNSAAAPEPSAFALLLAGGPVLVVAARRRRGVVAN